MKKIVVVGGGPAGLSAAIEGAENGFEVTLYEKNKIGENISCAEGFFDTLNMLGEPKYGVKYKVKEILVQLKSCYSFACDKNLNIWMMDKGEWQKGLADEARRSGVNIIENCLINKEILGRLKSENDWVIDATGAPSITSTIYGFSQFYPDTSAFAVQYTLGGDFGSLSGKFKVGMEENFNGYYWIFPKSEYEANVGIGCLDKSKKNLWAELDRVLEKEGIAGYRKIRKSGGLCAVKKLERLVYDNIILTGDAAGLVSPLHGGGIDTACISGKIAIQCILNNAVYSYESEIERVLGQKLKGEYEIQDFWNNIDSNVFDYLIKMCNDAHIKLGDCGFFNANFGLFRRLKHFRFLLTPLKQFIRIKFARNLIPPFTVKLIFKLFSAGN